MAAVVRPVGSDALLVEVPDGPTAEAFLAEVLRRRGAGEFAAVDVVPGARTVLIDGITPEDAGLLAADIPGWDPPPASRTITRNVEIAVRFDGPDIAAVAAAWSVPEEAVAGIVCAARLHVAFCGFTPGFGYLAGLDRTTPRRATPRASVPAGSVALAGEYAGVYPRSSPGGWQIIGTAVDAVLWDAEREPVALLEPGVFVTFVEVRG